MSDRLEAAHKRLQALLCRYRGTRKKVNLYRLLVVEGFSEEEIHYAVSRELGLRRQELDEHTRELLSSLTPAPDTTP